MSNSPILPECAIQLAFLLNSLEAKGKSFQTNEADAHAALKKLGVDLMAQPWFPTRFGVDFNEGKMRGLVQALAQADAKEGKP